MENQQVFKGSPSHSSVITDTCCEGYHANTTEEFADALANVLSLSSEEGLALRHRARIWAIQRFSEEEFERGWNASGWKEWLLRN